MLFLLCSALSGIAPAARAVGPSPVAREVRQAEGQDGRPPIVAFDGPLHVDGRQWLVVTLKSSTGPFGGFYFETDRGTRQWVTFPVRADGAFHTYSVWLGDEKLNVKKKPDEFRGTITHWLVAPTFEPDASGALYPPEFLARPAGAPFAIVEYCGPAEGLYRAGRTGKIAVRIRNGGGQPLRGLTLVDFASDTLTLLGPWRGAPDRIDPDQFATLYADVVARDPGPHKFQLAVTADGDRTTATGEIRVYPPYEAAAGSGAPAPGRIPEPKPLQTGYDIGVYYFSGWAQGDAWNIWPTIPPFAERRPLLGFHDESSSIVADWNIKWAVEHGVNFFDVLLYWRKGAIANTRYIDDALLKSRFLPHIKFFATWANDADKNPAVTDAEFLGFMDHVIQRYCSSPSYKRHVDGRPMIGLLSVTNMARALDGGGARLEALMREVEARARAAGFPGIFWVGGGGDAVKYRAAGFEGFSLYNYPGAGANGYPASPARTYFAAYPTIWPRLVAKDALTFVPVAAGFDHRPWRAHIPMFVRYGATPRLFAQHLADAKAFADSLGQKTIIIEAWNEWGEGSSLGPTAEHGFDLLQAIPQIFAPQEPPRPELGPQDVGVFAPEFADLWLHVTKPAFD